jgi:hypothetical protein
MLSTQSVVVAAEAQVSADLAGEVVILNLADGVYYGLDPVGARIWALLQEPRTVAELRDALLEEYEVDPEHCEHDILLLLQELAAAGLITVASAAVRSDLGATLAEAAKSA